MPEETKFKFNKELLQKKLNEVREYYQKYVGKKGHNPFFYLTSEVDPLQKRINDGEETPELSASILKLMMLEPKVFTGPDEVPAKYIAVPEPPKPTSQE